MPAPPLTDDDVYYPESDDVPMAEAEARRAAEEKIARLRRELEERNRS